ncbi:MAG TPA: hypothetical protein VMT17_08645 [Anaeromyxobacteraceae bacterium]|nr:hypothetical protein [Anaeromyxobacteraceae bacterium]
MARRRAGGGGGSAWSGRLAASLALLLFGCGRPESPGMQDAPLLPLAKASWSNVPIRAGEGELGLDVEQPSALVLPIRGAQELEIEYQASGILLLTYNTVDAESGKLPDHRGPPYRYRRLAPGRGRVRLDLRETANWSTRREPYLLLEGSGRFTITGLRYRPRPPDEASVRAALDRSAFLAPIAIGYTTVNLLYAPWWSQSERTFLYDRLGLLFLGLVAVGAVAALASRRIPLVGAIAGAAILATAASDAVFLAKLLPSVELTFPLDPEARIRENHRYAPKLGALAALARRTLPPGDRVAVRSFPNDWFAPEVLCFNLAPRRCATLAPGAAEYVGPSQVDRLRPDEVDAVVSIDSAEPLPPGFARVAEVSPGAYVARRR